MVLPEVVIHLRGSERVIADLKSSLRLEADGRRAMAGRNRIPLIVSLPPELTSEVTVDAPPSLVVLLSASAKKKLPIQSVDSSDLIEYMIVEGARELVDKSVSIRRRALSLQGGSPGYEVLDSDGEVVDPLNVLPIPVPGKSTVGLQTKTVVVSCNLIRTQGNLVTVTGYSAVPSTLQLRGTADALANLQNVTVDVPMTGITKSTTIRKRVRLPDGITSNFTGEPVVDVTITVREN